MTSDSMETLHAVGEFYSYAWTMLLQALGLILVVVGILVPGFTLWMQRRALKAQERNFLAKIQTELEKEKVALLVSFRSEMEAKGVEFQKKLDDMSETLKMEGAHLRCGVFLVQANHLRAVKNFRGAIVSACNGVEAALKSRREDHVQSCLNVLNDVLGSVKSTDIDSLPSQNETPESILKLLAKNNEDQRYKFPIEKLRKSLTDAKGRT